ncbi:DNA-binding HxlR family transcriptional regulator [Bradyrhizobium elkanii]
MAKRVSHRDSMCGVARPLDAIGDWWSLLIVRDAFDGLRRFGEFQKSLGLAKNILSARLRNLLAHGIMETVPASDGSPYQEYVLTEKGRGLFPLLVALRQWGEDFSSLNPTRRMCSWSTARTGCRCGGSSCARRTDASLARKTRWCGCRRLHLSEKRACHARHQQQPDVNAPCRSIRAWRFDQCRHSGFR